MIKRVSTAEVLAALGIGRRALAQLMADSETAGLQPPWFEVGSGRHKTWKWDPTRVDRWVSEVDAWRRSRSEARNTSSAGETRTGSSERAPSRTPAAAPTWAQMDACITAALELAEEDRTEQGRRGWRWRSKLLILLRFTGLRVDEQAMQLRWEDVDLDNREITIRGELGKSDREREGRIIPISPHLVEEMAGWGRREGYVLAPERKQRVSRSEFIVECWKAAKVPERIWGEAGGRGRGGCHHAFRKGFKTGLARLGVERDVRDYLLGHHRGIDENYIETLEAARDAVGMVPPLTCDRSVIKLDERRLAKQSRAS